MFGTCLFLETWTVLWARKSIKVSSSISLYCTVRSKTRKKSIFWEIWNDYNKFLKFFHMEIRTEEIVIFYKKSCLWKKLKNKKFFFHYYNSIKPKKIPGTPSWYNPQFNFSNQNLQFRMHFFQMRWKIFFSNYFPLLEHYAMLYNSRNFTTKSF